MKHLPGTKTFIYTALVLYSVITFLPFAWALSASFKPLSEIISGGMNFIPKQFTLDNYRTIFFQEPLFGRWLFNSILVAICITAFNLLFNSMAGYALARINFMGKQLWFFLILAVLMVPSQITLIPSRLRRKSTCHYAAKALPL